MPLVTGSSPSTLKESPSFDHAGVCSVLQGVPACLGGPSVCGGGAHPQGLGLRELKEECESRTLGDRVRMDIFGRGDLMSRGLKARS